jgi:hypothetical protein
MGDCALRPVAIEDFEAESLPGEAALDRGEAGGCLDRQQAARPLVAFDLLTDEIVRSEIAHVDDEPIDHGGGIEESGRKRRLRARGCRHQWQREHECETGGSMHGRYPDVIRTQSEPDFVSSLRPATMAAN